MYIKNGKNLQKEQVIRYNKKGQMITRTWFWNGEKNFHNTESFYYSISVQLKSINNSFADGTVEKTFYIYTNQSLKYSVSINQNKDTVDYQTYPNQKKVIKRWYMDGQAYRFDTTIFEKENVKLEYYGIDYNSVDSIPMKWHYIFKNKFNNNGSLIRTEYTSSVPTNSYTNYSYDKRGLLIKKEDVFYIKKEPGILLTYYFSYE